MSVKYHYGILKDATITEGDVTCDAQYPIENINILDKNVYTKLSDSGSEGNDQFHYIELAKVDFGEAVDVESALVDFGSLDLTLATALNNIVEVTMRFGYSSDGTNYTNFATLTNDTVGATLFSKTYNGIYDEIATEKSYRYWRLYLYVELAVDDTLDWSLSGNINNIFIGSYAELPNPQLMKYGLGHKTTTNESYSGGRSGNDKQGQRKSWTLPFNGFSQANWEAYEAFDAVCGQGAYPCYVESDLIDLVFARVFEGSEADQVAFELFELTNKIEVEL